MMTYVSSTTNPLPIEKKLPLVRMDKLGFHRHSSSEMLYSEERRYGFESVLTFHQENEHLDGQLVQLPLARDGGLW